MYYGETPKPGTVLGVVEGVDIPEDIRVEIVAGDSGRYYRVYDRKGILRYTFDDENKIHEYAQDAHAHDLPSEASQRQEEVWTFWKDAYIAALVAGSSPGDANAWASVSVSHLHAARRRYLSK